VRTLIFPVLTADVSFFTEYKLQGYKRVYFLIYFILKIFGEVLKMNSQFEMLNRIHKMSKCVPFALSFCPCMCLDAP
jgi:hypothetical protein